MDLRQSKKKDKDDDDNDDDSTQPNRTVGVTAVSVMNMYDSRMIVGPRFAYFSPGKGDVTIFASRAPSLQTDSKHKRYDWAHRVSCDKSDESLAYSLVKSTNLYEDSSSPWSGYKSIERSVRIPFSTGYIYIVEQYKNALSSQYMKRTVFEATFTDQPLVFNSATVSGLVVQSIPGHQITESMSAPVSPTSG